MAGHRDAGADRRRGRARPRQPPARCGAGAARPAGASLRARLRQCDRVVPHPRGVGPRLHRGRDRVRAAGPWRLPDRSSRIGTGQGAMDSPGRRRHRGRRLRPHRARCRFRPGGPVVARGARWRRRLPPERRKAVDLQRAGRRHLHRVRAQRRGNRGSGPHRVRGSRRLARAERRATGHARRPRHRLADLRRRGRRDRAGARRARRGLPGGDGHAGPLPAERRSICHRHGPNRPGTDHLLRAGA